MTAPSVATTTARRRTSRARCNPLKRITGRDAIPQFDHECRPDGEDCFQERWEYEFSFGGAGSSCCGGWGFPTAYIDPLGNRTEYVYDPANGNLIETRYPTVSGQWTIDRQPQAATKKRYYNTHGQTVRIEHPVVASGSRVDTFTFANTPGEVGHGYLQAKTVGSESLGIITAYEYDAAGNIAAIIDPAGERSEFLYNQANLLVREDSRPTAAAGGVRNRRDLFYDAALNLVRVDVENRDAAGVLGANEDFTTTYEYDSIGRLTRTVREVDASASVVEEMVYDGNDKVVLLKKGAAFAGQPDNIVQRTYDERGLLLTERVGGSAPGSATRRFWYASNGRIVPNGHGAAVVDAYGTSDAAETLFEYDQYDRLTSTTDPMGNITRRKYDLAGRLVRLTLEGQLDDVAPGMGGPNILLSETTFAYDERGRLTLNSRRLFDPAAGPTASDSWALTRFFHRADSLLARTADPDGTAADRVYDQAQRLIAVVAGENNRTIYFYDLRSNVVRTDRYEAPSGGGPGSPAIYRTEFAHDPLDRLIETVEVAQGGGIRNSRSFRYDSRNNIVEMRNARGTATTVFFDGLSRETLRETKLAPTGSERVSLAQKWDASSRLIARTDGNGNTTQYAYDPLDRLIVTRFADGTLEQVGSGADWSNPQGPVNLDDFTSGYDRRGNARVTTDSRGSRVDAAFDALDRVVSRVATPGQGVAGDLEESFTYDGRSLLVAADDPDTHVARSHDSLGRLLAETQSIVNVAGLSSAPAAVAYTYEIDGDLKRITYPNGRVIERSFDALDRLVGLWGAPAPEALPSGSLGDYMWQGPRVKERGVYLAQTIFSYDGAYNGVNGQGDRGIGLPAHVLHRRYVGGTFAAFDALGLLRDANGNPFETRDYSFVISGEPTTRTYDRLDRLVNTFRLRADSSYADAEYTLDKAHNLTLLDEDFNGIESLGVQAGEYARTSGTPAFDAEVHQYSSSPRETLEWDESGNLVSIRPTAAMRGEGGPQGASLGAVRRLLATLPWDARERLIDAAECASDEPRAQASGAEREGAPEREALALVLAALRGGASGRNADLTWDWRNRLVEYVDHAGGQRHLYRYDALGRRVLKVVDADAPNAHERTTRFLHGGPPEASHWQVLEEQRPDAAGNWSTAASFTFGVGIDEALHVWKAPGTAGGGASGADYYLFQDHLGSTTSVLRFGVANNVYAATIIERYRYGDYGSVAVLNEDGSIRGDGSIANSAFANTRLFTGREYDAETGLYHYRTRNLDPSLARFISRDSIGLWGDPANLGNPFAYVGMRPGRMTDPMGLQAPDHIMDQRAAAMREFARDTGLDRAVTAGFVAGVAFAASVVPGVGETMDSAVLFDPDSTQLEKSLAGASMGLDESLEGLAPNLSAFIFAGRILKRVECPKPGGLSAVEKGRAGERLAGIDPTKPKERITSALDPKRKRIPDEIDKTNKLLKESKNVEHLDWTRQLEDYAQIAQRDGLTMQLHTPSGTTFSRAALQQIQSGRITHVPYP